MLGLLSEAHRKNVQAISAEPVGEPYQSLRHLLAEAPCGADVLNAPRLQALMADRRTAPCDSCVLIIGDSSVPKRGQALRG